jgi:ACR3 family arsenite efflux pump ArsB
MSMSDPANRRRSLPDRGLTVWIFPATGAGVGVGSIRPCVAQAIGAVRRHGEGATGMPIAVSATIRSKPS